jgi:hypothetical protein
VSWTSDDGDHEGWAVAEFPDGRVSAGGGSTEGVNVRTPEDAIRLAAAKGRADVADGRTAIGWRGVCTCGWLGPLWRRVPAETAADPARHLVYWAKPDIWAGLAGPVEDAIREEWQAHLPSPALAEVKAAAVAARKAGSALDDAVRRARQDGATWEAIGNAAGMTRQAAHGRWQPVVTGEARRPLAGRDG